MLNNKQNDQRTNEFLDFLLHLSYNKKCADCGKPDPSWVSLNFALFICYECSSHHRSLGSKITKVKSVQMDAWSEEELRRMHVGGNKNVHKLSECASFKAKYSEAKELAEELDRLVIESREKDPECKFMDVKKETKSFVGKAAVVKQKKKKFSDVISTSEEEPEEKQSVANKEKMQEEVKFESEEDNFKMSSKPSKNLKKSVNSARSPFSFTVKEIEEEE